ncbi:MAG TPA: hypothetical protein VF590_12700 [Isosphaeraceae bacterium]
MPKTSKARVRQALRTVHCFSLIFSGPTELTQELEDPLYEAGCSDALLGIQNGEVFLDFHREAPSFRIALMSAIADVERAGVGLELIRVEPA